MLAGFARSRTGGLLAAGGVGSLAGAGVWLALHPGSRLALAQRPAPLHTSFVPGLPGTGFGYPLIAGITGCNVAVFLAWKASQLNFSAASRLGAVLRRHALASVPAVQAGRWHTLLTSAYSHVGIFHLGFNMMALHSFGPLLLHPGMNMSLTGAQFFAMYNVAALVGGLASYAVCRRARVMTPGLGASGAVFAVAQYALMANPSMGISLMFVPMEGTHAMLLLTAVNVALTVAMLRGGAAVDGAAHLGGQAVGIAAYLLKASFTGGGGVGSAPRRRPAPAPAHRQEHWDESSRSWGEGGVPLPPSLRGHPPPSRGDLTPQQTADLLRGLWGGRGDDGDERL